MARPRPCDRLSLTLNEAKATVLAATTWYRHNPRRQERAYYWCEACKGYHTTSEAP